MRICFYSVPGPVGSVSSIMGTTWAIISWSVPSYIPTDDFITNYELGYNVLQSHDCSVMDFESTDIQMNEQFFNLSTNITGLMTNTCYIFAVRAYTINGYGEWVYTTNKTLPEKVQTSSYLASTAISTSANTIPSTTQIISASTSLIGFTLATISSTTISTSSSESTSTTSTSTSSPSSNKLIIIIILKNIIYIGSSEGSVFIGGIAGSVVFILIIIIIVIIIILLMILR